MNRRHNAPRPPPDINHDMDRPLLSLDFGVMQEERKMMVLHTVDSQTMAAPRLMVDLKRKAFNLLFSVTLPVQHGSSDYVERLFKLVINFPQLEQAYMLREPDCTSFVLVTDSPPHVFRCTEGVRYHPGLWNAHKIWVRQTEIDHDSTRRASSVRLQNENCVIDIGRWLTYRLKFSRAFEGDRLFEPIRQALANSQSHVEDSIAFAIGDPAALWTWSNDSVPNAHASAESMSFLDEMRQMTDGIGHLPFGVRYQLEVCLSQGVLHECNITRGFVQKLAAMEKKWAVKVLEKAFDLQKRIYRPEDVFRLQSQVSVVEKKRPSYCAKILSAVVTPTTIYYTTPISETSNRVIRHYQQQHEDRFLRIRFSDERYRGKIWPQDDDRMQEVFSRMKKAMTHGIQIGDRHYDFLAFGNSQFREHGAYFFASTETLTAADIRQWMGNFSDIKVVAKYVSRLGQCFTTTRAIPIRINIERIPDVMRNGFCFTDGVGMISPLAAKMAADHVGAESLDQGLPSVYQFRLAGCKGVLAVNPALRGMVIQVRPSQEKFPAEYHGLEIVRVSRFSTAYLNMQIILVLNALGVPDSAFVDKQRCMLRDLAEAMQNEPKAVELLQKNVDFNQTTLALASIIADGFMETKDPFVVSCLRLWRSWSVKYLKEKARIFVDKGAFVFGCTDETGTLQGHLDTPSERKHGKVTDQTRLSQIFLQIPDPETKGRYKVVQGVCALARNPSLHPGDVRIVEAVDVPSLHHLKDCVVLPQTGDRDLANMCSGGDLDGDDFLIMWDPDLMPKEWNYDPMDYTAPEPIRHETGVTVDDMTSFFVTHIRNDNLSRIAVAHRYWADRLPGGIKHPICIRLANLHSKAVDYAKTGVPAYMPAELKVFEWPHWAEVRNKPPRSVYHSIQVLGKLYDQVERKNFEAAWDLKFDDRILNACKVSDEVLHSAQEVKTLWDEAVRRVMHQHGIKSEFEVYTTFVLEHHADTNEYKYAEKMGAIISTLKQHFQDLCYAKAGTDSKAREWSKMQPFIVAMYTVTANEMSHALEETTQVRMVSGREEPVRVKAFDSMPFISFPWIFARELGQIATRGSRHSTSMVIPKLFAKPKPIKCLLTGEDTLEPLPEVNLGQGKVHEGDILNLFHTEDREMSPVSTQDVERGGMAESLRVTSEIENLEVKGYSPDQTPPPIVTSENTSAGSHDNDPQNAEEVELEMDNGPSLLDRLAALVVSA